ncbi:Type I phosphodiesterase / nucleotide pyrophosphatase [Mycolicibacterium fluoranthenivorans]|uniref:Type I phosphodiesterase / nucleotide pyrophosphatase n=2 Tax=Mycobacteriaceae TaxID=1762 RepID=A0A1G4W9R7_9MYCO|nr:Type I phosphodiesterase / nucleotide pyrophosphatase [Mycolicibacterium fluoranthenivorans]
MGRLPAAYPDLMFITPRYGDGALADLLPSVLGALGVAGERDRVGLGLDRVRRVAVLLVDGMGAELVAARRDAAPFLDGMTGRTLTAGFPSTTAASLASLGTGVPAGEHGIVGYLLAVPGHERMMNPLKWRLMGQGPKVDLLKEIVPEQFQPVTTMFERAVADGVVVTQVAPMYQAGSGLTRAALRGGEFRPNFSCGDLVDGVLTALGGSDRALVYAYHGDLDMTGHVRGPDSEAWALELAHVDLTIRAIAERLPADAALIVTADHGMVAVDSPVDFDREPLLQAGVRGLGGEPRARHVYTEPGAASDVAAAWRELLSDDFTVLTRQEVIGEGWFGPEVAAQVAPRIGDVIAVPTGNRAVIRSGAEPLQSTLVGHHGSLTAAEMLVPLYVVR